MKAITKYTQGNEQVSLLSFTKVDKILCAVFGKKFLEYRKRWCSVEKEYIHGDYPLHLDVEVTYKCNYKCASCILSLPRIDKSLPDFMDIKLYKRIIDESARHRLPALQTSYFGEPLLRKDFHELVYYARKKGIMDVFITTNGALLTPDRSRQLIDSGITRIHVSLDANSSGTYDKVRQKGYYKKVLGNIHALIKIKGSNKLPIVRINFCRNSINESETDDFINYWKNKGADQISIQEYINMVPGKSHLFPKDRSPMNNFVCVAPFRRLTIRSNGDILPCCTIFGDKMVLGNAATDTIAKIWVSKKINLLRDMIKRGAYNSHPVCRICMKNIVGT